MGRRQDTRATTRAAPAVALCLLASAACSEPGPSAHTEADGTVPPLPTALWHDVTDQVIDSTAEWTNKVELADLNGDGLVDILLANGGDYSEPGDPVLDRVFLNQGPGQRFVERTEQILGITPGLTRVIKARDLNGDGHTDVFVGATYQTQSRLYLGVGDGEFVDRTSTNLPLRALSLGDVEPGDVDGDGDLDLVLADWGAGNNMSNEGGRTRLWLNDGTANFTDATADRMPQTLVRFSWDIELVDVDNDFDLDVLVSCKRCPGSLLYNNDGGGVFEENQRGLPQYTNNYEFEAMDLDGDGFLDLVTINDGEIASDVNSDRREHVFRNDGEGRYRDATVGWWPDAENLGEDDNVVRFLDFDSDGDADFLIGSLSGPDRLLINDGRGHLRSANAVFSGADTPGTLGMALADLDQDGRLDVVQAQGEVRDAEQERVFFGSGLEPDTAPPSIMNADAVETATGTLVRARIHDRKSPSFPTEWRHIQVDWQIDGQPGATPLVWYGEYLWRATIPPNASDIRICATDASGNETCRAVDRG